jgi:hypothetical protein
VHRPFLFVAVAAAIGTISAQLDGQQPTLGDVLARAGGYVTAFNRDFSGIVAEERYVQDISGSFIPPLRGQGLGPAADPRSLHREFKSDVLLVRPERSDWYMQYRDVFEVDGDSVRDRSDRLAKLFIEPTSASMSQAARIMAESARYNIGPVERNINVPVFALGFLDPRNQPRFEFTGRTTTDVRPGQKGPNGAHFSTSTEVWVVDYHETAPRTLIRTNNGRDLASRGRFWIEPSTGRVLMTELIAGDAFVHAVVTVTYEAPSTVGFLVPVEMREQYWQPGFEQRIDAVATYANFRRFQVTTDQTIATPDK